MKKLLSFLAAFGLVATSTTSVVACGSKAADGNPTASFGEYQKWVQASKENGTVSIVFIGGRQNSDTVSYLAAKSYWENGANINNAKLFDKNNITQSDNAISGVQKTDKQNPKAYVSDVVSAINNTVINSATDQNKNNGILGQDARNWLGNATEKDSKPKNYATNETANGLSSNSIIVDKIENFWTSDLGKNISSDLFNQINGYQEYKESVATSPNTPTTDKDKASLRAKRLSNWNTIVKAAKGPYFLVFRNGRIVGITTGFANYAEYNKEADKSLIENQYRRQSGIDMKNFLIDTAQKVGTQDTITWLNNVGTTITNSSTDNGGIFKTNKNIITGWNDSFRKFNSTSNVPNMDDLNNTTDINQNKDNTNK